MGGEHGVTRPLQELNIEYRWVEWSGGGKVIAERRRKWQDLNSWSVFKPAAQK